MSRIANVRHAVTQFEKTAGLQSVVAGYETADLNQLIILQRREERDFLDEEDFQVFFLFKMIEACS